MPVITVVGGQWGDEGKGKIVDLLAEKADMVIRFSGGDNAGHTVINPHGEFKLHLVPAGIFYSDVTSIIGNGVAVNPSSLLQELDSLKGNFAIGNLYVSDRAHIIMPYHTLLDRLQEERRGGSAIGTTLKGIGPVFTDKTARLGIRACDLLDKEYFKKRLADVLEYKNAVITGVYNASPLSFDEVFDQYCRYGELLQPYIREIGPLVDEAIATNKAVLMEGAQGTLLDPDFGTYPYVTSSSPIAANSALGAGIGIHEIDHVAGVFKAYSTRVGSGPMPTELHDETGDLIRNQAQEYGATTGRPRRCGWLDAVAGRFSARVNGFDSIIITRLDILDSLPQLKICVAYEVAGKRLDYFPTSSSVLEASQPVYEELPGWQTSTSGISKFDDLPANAKRYIGRIEELIGCPASIISVGASRNQTIIVKQVWQT